jgi:Cu2+-containing amine oxidase
VNFTLNGTNISYVPPADSVARYGTIPQFQISGTRKNSNSTDRVAFAFTASGTGTVPVSYVSIVSNNKMYVTQSMNVNITEYGPAGGYISGNFSGSIKDSTSPTIVPVNLLFRVKK